MQNDSTQPPVNLNADQLRERYSPTSGVVHPTPTHMVKPNPPVIPAAVKPNILPPLLTPEPQKVAAPTAGLSESAYVDQHVKLAKRKYEIGKKIVEWFLEIPALERDEVDDRLLKLLGTSTSPEAFADYISAAGYKVTAGRRHGTNIRTMYTESKRVEQVLPFEQVQLDGNVLHEPPLKPKTAAAPTAPAASVVPVKQKPAKAPKNVDVKLGAAAAEFQHLLELGGYEGEVTFTVKNGTAKHEANLSQVKKIKGIL